VLVAHANRRMEHRVDDLATFHPDLVGQCLEQGLDRCRRSSEIASVTITQSQREVEVDGDQRGPRPRRQSVDRLP